MSKTKHAAYKKCPYCGEKLYEDEMCRCRFEDEVEITTEVAVRTKVSLKGAYEPTERTVVSEMADRKTFCGFCGKELRYGEACRCRMEALPKSDAVSPVKINMRNKAEDLLKDSVKTPDVSASMVGGGIKSTMRRDSHEDKGFGKSDDSSHKSMLNKADDF